ncbi:lipase [Escherichia coli]|uniref:Lipase n=1 Tax=Escherichia coli TaxID=562 RepID=A0A484Y7S5_ECOLX|nr:lipase [Escherichia coli]
MALEKGIAELVEEFIAAGRPSSRNKVLRSAERAISPALFLRVRQKRG